MNHDDRWMEEALKEAAKAFEEGEVPIGAVIVYDDSIIARAHNQMERLKDPTAHAEMVAVTQAASALENWRLEGAMIYVTVEPCIMCAGALSLARIDRIVYGTEDPNGGGCGSVIDIAKTKWYGHRPEIAGGLLQERCRALMKEFFAHRRKTDDAT